MFEFSFNEALLTEQGTFCHREKKQSINLSQAEEKEIYIKVSTMHVLIQPVELV